MKRFVKLTPADHIKNLSSEIASLQRKKKLSKSEMVTYQHLVETFHDISTREFQYSGNHPEIRQKLLDSHGHWLEYVYNQAKARAKKSLALITGLALLCLATAYVLTVIIKPDTLVESWESRISKLENQLSEQSIKIKNFESDNQRILTSYLSVIDQLKKTREACEKSMENNHASN